MRKIIETCRSFLWSPPLLCKKCGKRGYPILGKCEWCGAEMEIK